MRNSKGMYINYNKTGQRRNRRRGRRNSGGLAAFLSVLLLAGGIGYGTYYVATQQLLKQPPVEAGDEINPAGNTQDNEGQNDRNTELTPKPDEASGEDTQKTEMGEAVEAKGIYIDTMKMSEMRNLNSLVKLLKETELNTLVIDIKNEYGNVAYEMDQSLAKEIGALYTYIEDIEAFMKLMKENNIYTIGRIVTFRDPKLAKGYPDTALRYYDGSLFYDNEGNTWLNPYNRFVWDYTLDLAVQAAKDGFNEINFDYLRVSTSGRISDVNFGDAIAEHSFTEIMTEFIEYACDRLHPLGIYVSADVYGTIINSITDGILVGQDFVEMAKHLDYICPMIYPSHYAAGYAGIDVPDAEPEILVKTEMNSATKKLSVIGEEEHCAIVRPWLQCFTASWVEGYITYGDKEIREQIEAVYSCGYKEWFLWNSAINYPKSALLPEE